ncbi:glycosyltransferase involved in cell wall biosynthesis [Lysobacter sp. HA35]
MLTWRDRDYIDDALDGALAQTVPCEIVVSNDASDDGTYERIVERLAGYAGPHRIRVRCNVDNVGVAAHVNAAMECTSGEIIVMMAGDDVSKRDRIARLLSLFDADPTVAAIDSDYEAIDAEGRSIEHRMHAGRDRFGLDYIRGAGRLVGLLGASLAFRREVFDHFGPLRGPIEDNALALRAALLGDCVHMRERLIRYRQHAGSVSSTVFARAESKHVARRKRYERTIAFYRGTADDFEHSIECMPELPADRRRIALSIVDAYRIEADAREALLQSPRRAWLGPIWRGLRHPGLRRKSVERALKLVLPRRLIGLR